jgi:hypothetical protein
MPSGAQPQLPSEIEGETHMNMQTEQNIVNENIAPVLDAAVAPQANSQPQDVDPLIADLLAARAELEGSVAQPQTPAEETVPAATPQAQPAPEPAPAAPAPTPAPQDGQNNTPMIPKPRLDEVLSKLEEANTRAAYFEGVANARLNVPAGTPINNGQAAAPAAPEPTFDDKIAELESKKLELADEYDNGKLTFKETTQKQADIDREIRAVMDARHAEQLNAAKTEGRTTARTEVMAQHIDQAARDIATNHPYVSEIDNHPNGKNIWNFIDGEAQRNLIARGVNPAQAHSNLQVRLELMKEKAVLTDKYGPTLTGKQVQTSAPAPSTTPAAAPAAAPAAPAETAEQRLAKIAMASNQPPSTTNLGNAGVQSEITESDILKMSDDEIAALPAAVRRRFTGA